MVATQFSNENLIRYEAREEGRAEGITEGLLTSIIRLLKNGGTDEQARALLQATPEQIEKAKSICFAM